MTNKDVLAEMVAGRLDEARNRTEQSARSASVARARAGNRDRAGQGSRSSALRREHRRRGWSRT
ncbi:hypothetical protein [Nocardia aurantiaca]|uniref:Uncharacterized protein n=1 Tax=Nocardia aurantiaca TaxID=2675850 RepID=A0A6I3L4N0_9NOCA|nr:hypothetical protein [Nocardia aurantiaca]MTE15624.1 hypothetical protein [Nocardia aurantiaca]